MTDNTKFKEPCINRSKYADMLGKVFTSVVRIGETVYFYTDDSNGFYLEHEQDCCEIVSLEDIVGDLADLVGHPILVAEESSNAELQPPAGADLNESYSWTFYKFATVKGWVDVRFFGASNGYYSEEAELFSFAGIKLPLRS